MVCRGRFGGLRCVSGRVASAGGINRYRREVPAARVTKGLRAKESGLCRWFNRRLVGAGRAWGARGERKFLRLRCESRVLRMDSDLLFRAAAPSRAERLRGSDVRAHRSGRCPRSASRSRVRVRACRVPALSCGVPVVRPRRRGWPRTSS